MMADGKATNCVTRAPTPAAWNRYRYHGTVAGSYGDDGVDAVDVEENAIMKTSSTRSCDDAAARVQKPGEGLGDVVQDAPLPRARAPAVALLVGAKQRNGERQPPCAGDDKRQTRAGKGIQAQDAGAAEDEGDAQDEGNGGAHVPQANRKSSPGPCVRPW